MFDSVDHDHSGELDYEEFRDVVGWNPGDDDGEIVRLFRLLDEDGSGSVAVNELAHALRSSAEAAELAGHHEQLSTFVKLGKARKHKGTTRVHVDRGHHTRKHHKHRENLVKKNQRLRHERTSRRWKTASRQLGVLSRVGGGHDVNFSPDDGGGPSPTRRSIPQAMRLGDDSSDDAEDEPRPSVHWQHFGDIDEDEGDFSDDDGRDDDGHLR